MNIILDIFKERLPKLYIQLLNKCDKMVKNHKITIDEMFGVNLNGYQLFSTDREFYDTLVDLVFDSIYDKNNNVYNTLIDNKVYLVPNSIHSMAESVRSDSSKYIQLMTKYIYYEKIPKAKLNKLHKVFRGNITHNLIELYGIQYHSPKTPIIDTFTIEQLSSDGGQNTD